MRRVAAACGKGLLLGIVIAFICPMILHRHVRPIWSHKEGIVISEDSHRLNCVLRHNWTEYINSPEWSPKRFGAVTSFALPADADSLSLLAHGSHQYGYVNFVKSTEESDTVDVNVRVSYHSEGAIGRAAVCLTGNAEDEYGVGIFTLNHKGRRSEKDRLQFDVEVILPAGKNGEKLKIKQLETKLPSYTQHVGDLWKTVSFGRIALSSVNGHVSVDVSRFSLLTASTPKFSDYAGQSVTAETGSFATSNGGISGHFNAESLELRTVNGPIRASVVLLNREGADPSTLVMHTGNGLIASEVTLTSDSTTGGKFDVDASTTNGFINLAFTESPVGATLKCNAKAAIGPVDITLAPEYEGSFSGNTVFGSAIVVERNVEDPEGKGRHREVSEHKAGRSVDGTIFWVESDGSHAENESSVEASTTVSAVKIYV
ncbi:hypothetical protein J3A83DRAFT_1032541 [Scleroderma citrinum]